jgi:hypothetical protein
MKIYNNAKGFIVSIIYICNLCVRYLSNWYNPETKGSNLTGNRIFLSLAGSKSILRLQITDSKIVSFLSYNFRIFESWNRVGAYAPNKLPKKIYGGKNYEKTIIVNADTWRISTVSKR